MDLSGAVAPGLRDRPHRGTHGCAIALCRLEESADRSVTAVVADERPGIEDERHQAA
jgi:hypothetical protein